MTIIKTIQTFQSPFWDSFFQAITLLGEETFILLVFTTLYWILDKRMAQFIGLSFFISLCVNTGLKEALAWPRPIGLEGIRSLRVHTATGFSFPSGHTQAVTALFASAAFYLRKRWMTWLAGITIVLVAISRLYLGVHWPRDVIAAIIIGLTVTAASWWLFNVDRMIPWALTASIAGLLPFVLLTDPDYAKAYGLLIGFSTGLLIEKRFVRFTIETTGLKKALRILVGLTGLLLIKEGLKPILPDAVFYDALRYALVALYGIAAGPWLFKRFNL